MPSALEPAALRRLARRVLTAQQLRVWELAEKGLSQQTIALALDLSRSTVRSHLIAARRNLDRALRSKGASRA